MNDPTLNDITPKGMLIGAIIAIALLIIIIKYFF